MNNNKFKLIYNENISYPIKIYFNNKNINDKSFLIITHEFKWLDII